MSSGEAAVDAAVATGVAVGAAVEIGAAVATGAAVDSAEATGAVATAGGTAALTATGSGGVAGTPCCGYLAGAPSSTARRSGVAMASAAIRRCFRSSAAGSATGTGRLACGRKKKSRRLTAMRACHSKVVVRTIALRVRGA